MEYSAKTDVGNIKFNNEDSYLALSYNEVSIFAVADGMGGHDFGEEASKIAIQCIKKQSEEKDDFSDYISFIEKLFTDANDKIYQTGIEKSTKIGMGTTLTMAMVTADKMYVGHVGDSRLYLINHDITQVTKDHSYVEQLVDQGMITKKEAKAHPKKNIITRALGTLEAVEVDIIEKELKKDDIILICSDGLSNLVEDSEIKEIILNADSLATANEQLIALAKNRGGYDNTTVVTIKNC